jgi:Ulp1 family protease
LLHRHRASKGSRDFESKEYMPMYNAQCPQQSNEWDCGIFVLSYLEKMCTPNFADKPEPTLEVKSAVKKREKDGRRDEQRWRR